jgi:hypothetical protein
MAKRNGGIIGPSNVPTPFAAKGVWKLRDAFNYIKAGLWPPVLGYQVNNSLRFNSGSSDNLSRTPSVTGNTKTWTFSCWVKRANLSSNQVLLGARPSGSDPSVTIRFNTDDTLLFQKTGGASSTQSLTTSQLFRDVSAWYHILIVCDTTQATSTNRVKMYVNGQQVTSFSSSGYPDQNEDLVINNSSYPHFLSLNNGFSQYFNGYMSEINLVDGQALTPSSFGQTDSATGIWTPIAYTGTYGTNGFYLKFANSAALGTDSSGNGNTWTANNLTSVDQSTDTPTNNFCTGNPLDNSGCVFTEGNLAVAGNASSDWNISRSTFGVSSGKWYWEVKPTSLFAAVLALSISTQKGPLNALPGQSDNFGVTYYPDGNLYYQSSLGAYGASYTTSDIIGVALNMDNGSVTFYKNGVSQGIAYSSLLTYGDTWFPTAGAFYANDAQTYNFGSPPYAGGGYTDAGGFGNFSYQPPSGYYALCTRTLAIYG